MIKKVPVMVGVIVLAAHGCIRGGFDAPGDAPPGIVCADGTVDAPGDAPPGAVCADGTVDAPGYGPPGTVCADGTVYAGNSPIVGTPKMFVTPCDIGMVWNGTSCTGTALSLSWNSGANEGYVNVLGVPDCGSKETDSCLSTDGGNGRTFTAQIVFTDANINQGGHQYHMAAIYCYCLGKPVEGYCAHNPTSGAEGLGHSDWYLPSLAELNVLYTNREQIGHFSVTGHRYYSSSEASTNYAWWQWFGGGVTGQQFNHLKYYHGNGHIRCARR